MVFQRALFEAFIDFTKISPGHIDELDEYWEDDPEWDDDFESDDFGGEDPAAQESEIAAAVSEQDEDASSGESLTEQQLLQQKNVQRAEQFIAALNHLVRAWPEFLTIAARHEVVTDQGVSDESFWLGTLAKPEGGIDFTQAASTRARDLLFVTAAMWLFDQTTDPNERSSFQDFWELCMEERGWQICMKTKAAINRFCKEGGAGNRILTAQDYPFDAEHAKELMEDRMRHLWEVMEL